MRLRASKLWLCAAPAVLSVLDAALTLYGQPPEYWAGDYRLWANEANPVVLWCLKQHPAAVLAETLLWVALFGVLIVILSWRVAKVVSLAVALGHVVGSSSWLEREIAVYWMYPVVLSGMAWLIVWTLDRAEARRILEVPTGPDRAPDPVT